MSKKKYTLLSEEQRVILKEVHEQIITEGLIRSGLSNDEMPRFMDSARRTFNTLLEQAQEVLQDKIEDEEIRKEIREDTDE